MLTITLLLISCCSKKKTFPNESNVVEKKKATAKVTKSPSVKKKPATKAKSSKAQNKGSKQSVAEKSSSGKENSSAVEEIQIIPERTVDEEVLQHAMRLGINLEKDSDLLWIAEQVGPRCCVFPFIERNTSY